MFIATACGGDRRAGVDLDADSDQNGVVEGNAAEDAQEEAYPGAIVLVNVDDDDLDGVIDCHAGESRAAQENDLTRVVLRKGWRSALPKGGQARLRLDDDNESFRVFLDGLAVLGPVGEEIINRHVLENATDQQLELQIEGLFFNRRAKLVVELADENGRIEDSDQLALSTAPFLMYSHLDPARRLYLAITDDNQALREGLKEAIGADKVLEYDADLYQGEIWFQDEFEFAYQQAPGGGMQLVLDAVTDWALDPFPEEELLAGDFGWLERGERPATIHTDSFGNLECTPPITVAGVEYPFGRIYYGGRPGGKQMVEGLRGFLDAQHFQVPLELDVTWLIVGHVDEVLTFVPDSTSPRGFRALVIDYRTALDILEGLDPRLALPRYSEMGYSSLQEILDDPVMELNAQVDQKHMQPLLSIIRQEFDLADEDIIFIPGLWMLDVDNAMAMIPNMVNLAVFNQHLLIADPFFRTPDDGVSQEEDLNANWRLDPGEDLDGDGLLSTHRDPLIQYVRDQLPAELVPHFLDDWNDYHLAGGEVHCATNILRTPREDLYWWQLE